MFCHSTIDREHAALVDVFSKVRTGAHVQYVRIRRLLDVCCCTVDYVQFSIWYTIDVRFFFEPELRTISLHGATIQEEVRP